MFKMKYLGILFVLALIGAVVYRGVFSHGGAMPGGMPPGGAMPAEVAQVVEKEVESWSEFSGRLEAVDKVQIKPRVGGNIQRILFDEGAIVKKDQALFVIDQRPFIAEVQKAEASLASAKTQSAFANSEFIRADALVKQKIVTQSRYDEKLSAKQSAESNLKSTEAALNLARLNLEYSTIRAPITGKISRAEITEGNLVDPAAGLVLATIVSIDPIFAEFNIDEQTYLKFADSNKTGSEDTSKIPVEIMLASETSPSRTGYMRSFDNQLNTTTGTIRARAVFENTDGKLLPGLFATVRMGSPVKKKSILISDRAVGTDQDKKFALAVNKDNKVEYRPLVVGGSAEGLRIVESGLNAGDKVIISGLFKYRPDTSVIPQESPMEGTQAMAKDMKEVETGNDVQKLSEEPAKPEEKK